MKADDLIVNGCYFLLTYHDQDLRLPSIETYVFLGKNIFGLSQTRQGDRWFFQSAESVVENGPFRPQRDTPSESITAAGEEMIEDFDDALGLIERLRKFAQSGGLR
jgi:hypothetical protein